MNSYHGKFGAAALAAWLAIASLGATADAQYIYPTYRIVYRTVYEDRPITTYRRELETHFRDQVITTRKPVWNTETRVRRITVHKPVYETSTHIQRQTVRRPVWETELRTSRRIVHRPITEQVMQTRNSSVLEPVTTLRTEVVDQGSFVNQTVEVPGAVRNRLQWVQGGYVTDPATGALLYQRSGFYWVPTQGPSTLQVQTQYVPNYVQRQVPETTYQQKVVQEQVPVNVTRYEQQIIEQPYEVQVCKWVDQIVEKPIQVTTRKMQAEIHEQPYEVRTCKWVIEEQTVRVPYTVAKWVAHQSTQRVARTVAMRVPIDPCTGHTAYYVPSNISYYAPLTTTSDSIIVSREPAVEIQEAQPAEETGPASGESNTQEEADVKPALPSNVQITPIPLENGGGNGSAPGDDGIDADANSA